MNEHDIYDNKKLMFTFIKRMVVLSFTGIFLLTVIIVFALTNKISVEQLIQLITLNLTAMGLSGNIVLPSKNKVI